MGLVQIGFLRRSKALGAAEMFYVVSHCPAYRSDCCCCNGENDRRRPSSKTSIVHSVTQAEGGGGGEQARAAESGEVHTSTFTRSDDSVR